MIIDPAPLRKRPRQLRGEIPTLDLALEALPFVRPGAALQYDLRAECVGDELLLRGTLALAMECLCARCGAWFKRRQLVPDFTRSFQIAADNAAIDLTPDIREDIILSFPSNWLCRDDCRGLCAGCGVDLNQGECRCPGPRRADYGNLWEALERMPTGDLPPGGGAQADRIKDRMEGKSDGSAKTQKIEE